MEWAWIFAGFSVMCLILLCVGLFIKGLKRRDNDYINDVVELNPQSPFINDANLDFIKCMEDCAEEGVVGLDYGIGHIEIDSSIYENIMCDGPYTPLNETKAHNFFVGVRNWIDFRRGIYNGENDAHLPPIGDNKVTFAVKNIDGKVYLVGNESKGKVVVDKS